VIDLLNNLEQVWSDGFRAGDLQFRHRARLE
jgi:hypothetical protein